MKTPKLKLTKEIALALTLKGILLVLLWYVCFHHPLTDQAVVTHLSHVFQSPTYARQS